jgi:hypothetical protein
MFTAFLRFRRMIFAFMAMALLTSVFSRAATGNATVGQTATFSIVADGTAPFTYQWTRNASNIPGATTASYVISKVQPTDAATYAVVVSNSAGSVTSDNAILAVVDAASTPVFTTQPSSQTVTAGTAVSFVAGATGLPAPTYQWQVNGTNILGATSASYTITNAGLGNAGTYTLVAANATGSATSNGAVLTVNTVPVVPTQAVNQTVNVGQNAIFTITGSGSPPPAYQWQLSANAGTTWTNLENGTSYSGVTTATLVVLRPAVSASANQFHCLITNSAGTATSNGFVLTVVAPPSSLQISIRID